jgi:deazaflavin-dependent oxidoreductase (nitroreductase family)
VSDWNRRIIEEFRSTGGQVGGRFEGAPMVLLHTRGRRTGAERVNPLVYRDLGGGSVAVFASKAGAPTHPDWYRNLVDEPSVTVEIGTETVPMTARVAAGDERSAIWEAQKRDMPGFAEYERSAGDREIPVVVLTPA